MSNCYMLLDLILRMVIHGRKHTWRGHGGSGSGGKQVHPPKKNQSWWQRLLALSLKQHSSMQGSYPPYGTLAGFQINQNKLIVKECLFVL